MNELTILRAARVLLFAAVAWSVALAPAWASTGAEARSSDDGASAVSAPPAEALTELPVREELLPNGMRVLLLPLAGQTMVSAGWVARVGSAVERPGQTGLTHLLEHLLFKGTETVGARDLARERAALREEERIQDEMEDLRVRGAGPRRLAAAQNRFDELAQRSFQWSSPVEFNTIYAEAGAVGVSGLTLQDMTLFTTTLPAEKLELWFWMETDRLAEPVLRQFYLERSVVREERRQRAESRPTGLLEEELRAMAWHPHPYRLPVLGLPDDVEALRRADARAFFERYYRPENLTAVLVGGFREEEAVALARRYFGRLGSPAEGGAKAGIVPGGASTPRVAVGPREDGERRLEGECACRPQVHMLYQTVPFGHPDAPALEVLVGLLNGRTGRLHRSLVLDRGIAFAAYAIQNPMRLGGMVSLTAEAREGRSLADVQKALEEEITRLAREPVAARELTKVKNQVLADTFRARRRPSDLLMQLLTYDALGDWRHLHRGASQTLEVEAEDVQRVARRYFVPANRTVGRFDREPTGAGR